MYKVQVTREAAKQLAKISKGDRKLATQIADAIESLAADPRPDGCKKLAGRDGYRIRIREYRVLYTVADATITVEVFRIGARGGVY